MGMHETVKITMCLLNAQAIVDKNIVQGHVKVLKSKMSQLTQEHEFYNNVYKRLSKELRGWENGIRECLLNMNAMYTDRNQYHDAVSGMFSGMPLNIASLLKIIKINEDNKNTPNVFYIYWNNQ